MTAMCDAAKFGQNPRADVRTATYLADPKPQYQLTFELGIHRTLNDCCCFAVGRRRAHLSLRIPSREDLSRCSTKASRAASGSSHLPKNHVFPRIFFAHWPFRCAYIGKSARDFLGLRVTGILRPFGVCFRSEQHCPGVEYKKGRRATDTQNCRAPNPKDKHP